MSGHQPGFESTPIYAVLFDGKTTNEPYNRW